MIALSTSRFEIFRDRTGRFRFRLVENGEVIFASYAYLTKEDCLRGIELLRELVPKARVEDRVETARSLMSKMKAEEFLLNIGQPVELGEEIIALKSRDGSIVLYEVIE